jgi:hypothetical protein
MSSLGENLFRLARRMIGGDRFPLLRAVDEQLNEKQALQRSNQA